MSDPTTAAEMLAKLVPPFGGAPHRLHATPVTACILNSTPATVEAERCRRRWKIPVIRVGRKVLYRESDLLEFINRCRVEG